MRQTLMSLQGMLIIIALILQGARTLTSREKKLVCPEGWDYFEDANMCIQPQHHPNLNYYEGQLLCQDIVNNTAGSGLPVLLSDYAIKAMVRTMIKLGFNTEKGGYSTWLGADDIEEENSFRWRLNGQFTKRYIPIPFGTNQPNDKDKSNKGMKSEDCLVIHTNSLVDDYPCSVKWPVICSIYNANLCSEQNGGCEQKCIITGPHARRCECEDGFTVQEVFYCEDVDECLDGKNGNCQQICSNFHGGRECFCHPGYIKDSETSCVQI